MLLGFQHLFAMFGATVLVPVLTGLSITATLLFAGLGTLLFHFLTKGKVPAFLGSSFAFLGGYYAVAGFCPEGTNWIPYAVTGVACSGLLYVVLAVLIRQLGVKRVMKFFPPVVTGPIIIAIGVNLSAGAVKNCETNWLLALVAIGVVIVANIWGKGMVKIIPIFLGVIASYLVGAVSGAIDWTPVQDAAWFGMPFKFEDTAFSLFTGCDTSLLITSIITILPIALATMVEHIGDMCAISETVGNNYLVNPGLHRTLLGDGLATIMASFFGAPANTTYGENTGVLALSKVYDPRVIRLAAIFAVILSFCPKFAAVIEVMPTGTMGGISLVLYGMIASVGVRNVVENQVDFSKQRNVLILALILVLSIGINYSAAGAIAFTIGEVTISLSGLACGALVGIIVNAILPGKDYEFNELNPEEDRYESITIQ
ncbi:MAG: uracil-xanthine permease family protein [Clostridia bacterium]|nr:uracil-xanthine permease family protein [Clostridia bacterium]